jgi:parallel beta-helix repeat protein
VWEGEYRENVVVNKSLSLIGNGSDSTHLEGESRGSVVRITSDWVNMVGFYITDTNASNSNTGIFIESNNSVVSLNNCSNLSSGIYLKSAMNCTIESNVCSNNEWNGIKITDSVSCTISNNSCSLNRYCGIFMEDTSECIVDSNICLMNDQNAFYIRNSNLCTIKNNTVSSRYWDGIYLQNSYSCTLESNRLIDSSISISGDLEFWISHTITPTNSVNGKSVFYFSSISGITVPSNAGQVILADCTLITVEDQTCNNGTVGILIGYSSDITLENNTCNSNKEIGIFLYSSTRCLVKNNVCKENRWSGINIDLSSHCSIENNTCSSNDEFGIRIRWSMSQTLVGNTCSENDEGIYLDADNSTLISNICERNDDGMFIGSSGGSSISNICSSNTDTGMKVVSSPHFQIVDTVCSENAIGISFYDMSNSSILNSTISSNDEYGIALWVTYDSRIEYCTIVDNLIGIRVKDRSRNNSARSNSIFNNFAYGINASENDNLSFEATYNWWGNSNGPFHPTGNPEGDGNSVSNGVNFSPWLDEDGGLVYLPEDDSDTIVPYLLLSIFVLLSASLIFVVIDPKNIWIEK